MRRLIVETFTTQVLNNPKPTLVLFKNKYCGLCDGMISVMFRIKAKHGHKINLGYVETSEQEDLADLFEITGVPTLFFFEDGNGTELEYPTRPDVVSGYSEQYIDDYLRNRV